MNEWLVTSSLLAATGVLAGFLAGLFGIGGGMVIVPALYFYLQRLQVPPELAMAMAINTSLVSIIPTSLSSMRAHHGLGNVDWPMVRNWVPGMVVGVLVGGFLVASVRSPVFTLGFGLLLLGIATGKLIGFAGAPALRPLPSIAWQRATAMAIGFVSVCAGVGGGATGVPAMVAMGVPIHRAIGTCAALGLSIAAPGALAIVLFSTSVADAPAGSFKLIYLPALFLLAPLTIICAPVGARLGKRLTAAKLNLWFALILTFLGVKMMVSAF